SRRRGDRDGAGRDLEEIGWEGPAAIDFEHVAGGRRDVRWQLSDDPVIVDADDLEIRAPEYDEGRLGRREAKSDDGQPAKGVIDVDPENERPIVVSTAVAIVGLRCVEWHDQRRQKDDEEDTM